MLKIHTNDISKNEEWVSEDAIVATGDYLQREMHVFLAKSNAVSPPLIYSPQTFVQAPPVLLAYYEPGHYKAIVGMSGSKLLPTSTMYLNACSLCISINNNDHDKSATHLNSAGEEMYWSIVRPSIV